MSTIEKTRARTRIRCIVCSTEASAAARLEAWQISRDGHVLHCAPCADLLLLDDALLFWPHCGHLDERAVLYDRAACLICEAG